jgi:endo-1,4-beta-xylanase
MHPADGSFVFTDADWMMTYAKQHDMTVRAHCLCWNTANPAWVASTVTTKNASAILSGHIDVVVKRYAGRIDTWNVVNEPITGSALSTGPWLSTLGEEYIDLAFHTARAADPKATLLLNLNHTEALVDQDVRTASLNLIEALLKRSVPVQAIGLESHIDCNQVNNSQQLRSFVTSIRSLGLSVQISECDANDAKIVGSDAFRDSAVASTYVKYLETVLPISECKRLTFWSPTNQSWMDAMAASGDAEYTRADGTTDHRPGLVNAQSQTTPAYTAIQSVLG